MSKGWMLLLGVSALSSVAHAQTATPPSAPAESSAAKDDGDIVVTGSRVIANGNASPTPVTVLSIDQLQAAKPSTVFESLLEIPAFAGSRGGVASNPSGNSSTSGQISALNLRGLGPVRTLTLFDGRRVPPSQQDGFVNANTVPQMLLQRVDIVTGGVSAVYGSDAVAGVVNFVTDRKFTGVKFDIQRGIAQRGDGGTYQIGGAFGLDLFGGRGHFMASVENFHDDGILDRNARDQFLGRWTVQGNGCPNGVGSANCYPFYLVAGANATAWTYGGKITGGAPAGRTNPYLNYTFNADGTLRPFVNGTTVPGSTAIQIGGDGIWDTGTTLKPQQDVLQGYGRFDFDLTDDARVYASIAYTRDRMFNYFGDVNSNSIIISAQNPFLATAYRTAFATAGITTFNFSKKYGTGDLVPRSNINNQTETIYATLGLAGKIGDFDWDASYTRSRVELTTTGNFTFDNGKLFAALDAVVNPATGQIVCNVTLTNPTLYPGCVPINLFGVGSETQAMVDYVRRQGTFVTKLPLDDFNASISGRLFDTWAGPLKVALSGEWRRQGLEVQSTNPTVDYAPLDCTGLRFNCTNRTATNVGTPSYNGGVAPRPLVYTDTAEGAIEADIPLLKDSSIARSLNVNLGARYASYRAVGNPDITKSALTKTFNATTWKAGIDWHVNDMLRLRATLSRDIRAPNLSDLFRTNGTTFTNGNTDYLTGRQLTGAGTLPAVVNGGNPNLKPEVANTLTVGGVFKPVPNLSIAVDFYRIKVNDFITSLSGADQLFQQACYASGGTSFYCTLQERPGSFTDTSAANAITKYYVIPANVAQLQTAGVDVEVNWSTRLGDRPLSIRTLVSYQPHVYFDQPGSRRQDFAGALGTPVAYATSAIVRATLGIRYAPTDAFTIDWQTRFRGKMRQSPDPALLEEANAGAPAVSFSNVTLTYTLPTFKDGRASLYLNVTNVFDQHPSLPPTRWRPAPGSAAGSCSATIPSAAISASARASASNSSRI